MKFYKDNGNNVWAYEDDIPEFGSHTEQETTAEDGTVTVEKIYPEFTVKEGLIAITQEEANEIRAKAQAEIEVSVVKVVPQSLTQTQAKTVLMSTPVVVEGVTMSMYDATDKWIEALDRSFVIDEETGLSKNIENIAIYNAWHGATFLRTSNTILMAQKMFNLTDEQVDNLFILGAKIEA